MDSTATMSTTDLSVMPNEVIDCFYSPIPTSSMMNFSSTCKMIRDCRPKTLVDFVDLKIHRRKMARSLRAISKITVFSDNVDSWGLYTRSYFIGANRLIEYRLRPNGTLMITSGSINEKPFGENWKRVAVGSDVHVTNGSLYPVLTKITVAKFGRCNSVKYHTTIEAIAPTL